WVGFGRHFGIGVVDDLGFSLAILRAIIYGDSKTNGPITNAVLKLYLRIQAQYLVADERENALKKVMYVHGCHLGAWYLWTKIFPGTSLPKIAAYSVRPYCQALLAAATPLN